MEAVTTLPRRRDMTRDDLDALPDDGWRHELIDGSLIMTPAPQWPHQSAVVELAFLLKGPCPPDLRVIVAPFDVALGPKTVVQPDILVTRRSDITTKDLPTAPLLAIEVLSPSTRLIDLGLKKATYEAARCPAYWIVDPGSDHGPPSLTTWELRDDQYVETARGLGDQPVEVRSPYSLTVVPSTLVT